MAAVALACVALVFEESIFECSRVASNQQHEPRRHEHTRL